MSFWEDTARVPLIISAPGFASTAGSRSEGIVELIDLYPTLADLCGLADRAPGLLQGRSLVPLLKEPSLKTWEPNERGAYTVMGKAAGSVRTDRWRYNRWDENSEALYDHRSDPDEFTNLVNDPAHQKTLEAMRALLESRREGSLN